MGVNNENARIGKINDWLATQSQFFVHPFIFQGLIGL